MYHKYVVVVAYKSRFNVNTTTATTTNRTVSAVVACFGGAGGILRKSPQETASSERSWIAKALVAFPFRTLARP